MIIYYACLEFLEVAFVSTVPLLLPFLGFVCVIVPSHFRLSNRMYLMLNLLDFLEHRLNEKWTWKLSSSQGFQDYFLFLKPNPFSNKISSNNSVESKLTIVIAYQFLIVNNREATNEHDSTLIGQISLFVMGYFFCYFLLEFQKFWFIKINPSNFLIASPDWPSGLTNHKWLLTYVIYVKINRVLVPIEYFYRFDIFV